MEIVIEVFKTSVPDERSAQEIVAELRKFFPEHRINFDLDDCDKILRIEGDFVNVDYITQTLHEKGFDCSALD